MCALDWLIEGSSSQKLIYIKDISNFCNFKVFFDNRDPVSEAKTPTAEVLFLSLLILFLLFLLHIYLILILIEDTLKLNVWLPLSREERSEVTSDYIWEHYLLMARFNLPMGNGGRELTSSLPLPPVAYQN